MSIHSTLKTLKIIKKVLLSTLFATILLMMVCFITSCSQKVPNQELIELPLTPKDPSKQESFRIRTIPRRHLNGIKPTEKKSKPPLKTPRTVKEWLDLHDL